MPPATLARAVTLPATSIVIGWVVAWATGSISPITARVLRSVSLTAAAMPAPTALPLATPPAQLISVSRLPA